MRCKFCKTKFIPKRFLMKFCCETDECAKAFNEYAKKAMQKTWNKEKTIMKESLLTRTDRLDLLQKVFNTYIRMRDAHLPCISCDTTNDVKYDAGHFYSQGNYSFIRFHEDNVHKQCSNNCNKHLSGNFHEYRPRLIKKIGIERVEWLEANRHKKLELNAEQINELIETYKHKLKQLK